MIDTDRGAKGCNYAVVRRSVPSVPDPNLRMAERAFASDTDAVLLDPGGCVVSEAKAEARRNVVRGSKEFNRCGKAASCRANALDMPHFYRDLTEVLEEPGEDFDAALIPKVGRPEDLYAVGTLLAQIELTRGLEGKGSGSRPRSKTPGASSTSTSRSARTIVSGGCTSVRAVTRRPYRCRGPVSA